MSRVKLDRIDRRILQDLQENGRITNVELARRAGISAPPCLRRVRTLEKSGYIRGYHADLDPGLLGFGVTVFAQVEINSHKESDLREFEAQISRWPMVRECYMLAGDVDFLLKIVAKDWDDYQKFLTSALTATPNVGHVKTMMTIRPSKQLPGIPLESETAK